MSLGLEEQREEVKDRDGDRGQGKGQEKADAGARMSGQQWQGPVEAGAVGVSRNQKSFAHSLVRREDSYI